ncbi:hypothetical protein ACIRPT_07955 [Streptomyces sp. NPDC101227]|uniref:hypothetical protein n=1 Tax=Streptomyces sp. NPDC101227 TaxID=3366136 RepID=UPI00382A7481
MSSLTPDNPLAHVRLRLISDDYLPPEALDVYQYVRPVAEGLVEALAFDLPDAIRLLTDSDVAEFGLDALRAAGRANLAREPFEYDTAMLDDGTVIHTVGGESLFVASQVLVLDEVMRTTHGAPPPPEGVLVTVPGRQNFAFHPITDHHAVSAANALAEFGLGSYEESPDYSVSPWLYWWHDGTLTSLTAVDEESRTLAIEPPEELLEILQGLDA